MLQLCPLSSFGCLVQALCPFFSVFELQNCLQQSILLHFLFAQNQIFVRIFYFKFMYQLFRQDMFYYQNSSKLQVVFAKNGSQLLNEA